MFLKLIRLTALLALASALAACATKTPSLYSWQGYQANLDAYFRASSLSPDAQVQLMEQDLQKIRASGLAVPPGYHAHMGLLYGEQGDLDKFAQQVAMEKSKFPESQTFMDFLTRKFKK
ncbi:MAG: DUF4810 domain-containing protein [Rhodoferax sp.]|nr:DUF4810 domain-containing protein [Rhodoferax sp.]